MKKFINLKFLIFSIVFVVCCLLYVILLVCNFKKVDQKSTKPLVVGFDPSFPPMGFVNEGGNICGADVDFMKLAAKFMGKEIKFQPIDWDAKELELNSGNIDLIANGLSKTPDREESMTLTEPYMANGQVIVVKFDSLIKTVNDLNGKQVCFQKGSSGEVAFEKSSVSKLVQSIVKLESCVDCLNEVKQGKVDAAIVDETVARYYLHKMDDELSANNKELEILAEPLSVAFYVVAVKKGNLALKNELESAFKKIVNLKETDKISQIWFGKGNMFKFGQLNDLSSGEDYSLNNNFKGKFKFFSMLLAGFLTTFEIFVICLAFSLPLGLFICFMRFFKFKFLNWFISFYIAVMRGTPLLLQLFFAFYGLPILFPGLILKNRFLVGLITFILNYAAYFAEIFRGGLLSISVGQFEAIEVLQIPKIKAIFKIVMPQMFQVCLPAICNETVALIKDTALIFSIGVIELLTTAKNLVNATADVSFYFFAAIIYFLSCSLLKWMFDFFEKKLKFD